MPPVRNLSGQNKRGEVRITRPCWIDEHSLISHVFNLSSYLRAAAVLGFACASAGLALTSFSALSQSSTSVPFCAPR
jgi:hypothetical protein